MPNEGPDERCLCLSDILPTAWQALKYADAGPGSTLAVIGLGPVGQLSCRAAFQLGAERVIGVDLLPKRLELAHRFGIETIDLRDVDGVPTAIMELTGGRDADSVIDAVGMEAATRSPRR